MVSPHKRAAVIAYESIRGIEDIEITLEKGLQFRELHQDPALLPTPRS
jgi:hypothetical protein